MKQYRESQQYEGIMTLVMHLWESQSSRYSWHGGNSKGKCPIPACSVYSKDVRLRKSDLRAKHYSQCPTQDPNPEESMQRVRDYFRFNYHFSDEQVQKLKQNRLNHKAQKQAKKQQEKTQNAASNNSPISTCSI